MKSKKRKVLNQLEGKTIESLTHAGAVTVHNGQLVMDGDIFEPNPDTATLEELLREWEAEFDMIPWGESRGSLPTDHAHPGLALLGTNLAATVRTRVPNFRMSRD